MGSKHPHRGSDFLDAKLFGPELVFGDGDSMHNLVQSVHAIHFRSKTNTSKTASAKEWSELFTTALYKTSSIPEDHCISAVNLSARLALTNPKSLQSFWKEGSLIESKMTCAWYSAYAVFGATWALSAKKTKPSLLVTPDPKKPRTEDPMELDSPQVTASKVKPSSKHYPEEIWAQSSRCLCTCLSRVLSLFQGQPSGPWI